MTGSELPISGMTDTERKGDSVLSVRNATVMVGRPPVPVIRDINLEVSQGEIVGVVGESGSGKTTFCRMLAGLLHEGMYKGEGEICVGGVQIGQMAPAKIHRLKPRGIAMVFQDPLAALNPIMRIGDQLGEALAARGVSGRAKARRAAADLLDRMHVADAGARLSAYPMELSGGERQRVVIAIAMAADPLVLLADEPTSALDVTIQKDILQLIQDLARERRMAVVFVSHNIGVVAEVCSRLCVMYGGHVIEAGATASILAAPAHPYTAGLIASLPSVDARKERLPVIAGRSPRPGEIGEGCPFVPRCAHSRDACSAAPMILAPPSRNSTGRLTACIRAGELYGQRMSSDPSRSKQSPAGREMSPR